MTSTLTFDAVSEAAPGPKWRARWDRSWPEYRAWFLARGGADGPDRATCEAALERHMPELLPVYRRLVAKVGGGDLEARFLSTWCPPAYLGGCSLAAMSRDGETRLVRNYDLSPDLNEGLLLHSAWSGTPVMGMVEFLWGLSDGINGHGLSVALAFGGTTDVGEGFGICTILRHVLETCHDVPEALAVLRRVPSHMDYNIVLADAAGRTASVEMIAGGGCREVLPAAATNHRRGDAAPPKDALTRTLERGRALDAILTDEASEGGRPETLHERFLEAPLFARDYDRGFGTLFTAVYDPRRGEMRLIWPDREMRQSLSAFAEATVTIDYVNARTHADWDVMALADAVPPSRRDDFRRLAEHGRFDWVAFGALFCPADATPPADRSAGVSVAPPSE